MDTTPRCFLFIRFLPIFTSTNSPSDEEQIRLQISFKRFSPILTFALRIVIGASVLAILLGMISWGELTMAFSEADVQPLVAGFLLAIPHIGFQVYKWLLLMRTANEKSGWREAGSSLLFSMAVGSFTPGRLGEIPGRSLLVTSLSAARCLSLALLDKVQMFLFLILVGIPSILIVLLPPSWEQTVAGGMVVAGSLILFFRTDVLATLPHILPARWRRSWIMEYQETLSPLPARQSIMLFLLTVASYAMLTLQVFSFLNAFEDVSAGNSFLGLSAMMAAKTFLPVSIGDIGIREAGSVFFFTRVGVSATAAFHAAVMVFFSNVLIPSLLGLLFLPKASLARRRMPKQ